jgi:hypothetical protein
LWPWHVRLAHRRHCRVPPPAISLADKVNKLNYSFTKPDRNAIVKWFILHLEVSRIKTPLPELPEFDKADKTKKPLAVLRKSVLLQTAVASMGSKDVSKSAMVGLTGFEPATP